VLPADEFAGKPRRRKPPPTGELVERLVRLADGDPVVLERFIHAAEGALEATKTGADYESPSIPLYSPKVPHIVAQMCRAYPKHATFTCRARPLPRPRRRGAGRPARRRSSRATRAGPDGDPPDEPEQLGGQELEATTAASKKVVAT
jgi:hypothetical protein